MWCFDGIESSKYYLDRRQILYFVMTGLRPTDQTTIFLIFIVLSR